MQKDLQSLAWCSGGVKLGLGLPQLTLTCSSLVLSQLTLSFLLLHGNGRHSTERLPGNLDSSLPHPRDRKQSGTSDNTFRMMDAH